MTGIEIIKAPGATAGELVDIISKPCPPVAPTACDRISCRECWLAWLVTGESPRGGDELAALRDDLELARLRKLLQEIDAYVSQNQSEGPLLRRTAQGEELVRIKQLLNELDSYVSGTTRARTSQ